METFAAVTNVIGIISSVNEACSLLQRNQLMINGRYNALHGQY